MNKKELIQEVATAAGEEITIPAHKFPYFKASSVLKKSAKKKSG